MNKSTAKILVSAAVTLVVVILAVTGPATAVNCVGGYVMPIGNRPIFFGIAMVLAGAIGATVARWLYKKKNQRTQVEPTGECVGESA
jgi:hypothetical protein